MAGPFRARRASNRCVGFVPSCTRCSRPKSCSGSLTDSGSTCRVVEHIVRAVSSAEIGCSDASMDHGILLCCRGDQYLGDDVGLFARWGHRSDVSSLDHADRGYIFSLTFDSPSGLGQDYGHRTIRFTRTAAPRLRFKRSGMIRRCIRRQCPSPAAVGERSVLRKENCDETFHRFKPSDCVHSAWLDFLRPRNCLVFGVCNLWRCDYHGRCCGVG